MKKAFTLVELAIVIVIIGLLVGGVLAGQELVNQAKVRAQIKQLEAFDAAAVTFKSKYGFLPGDIPLAKASMFQLGSDSSANGDGRINDYAGQVPPVTAWSEPLFFLVNLYQSKLIKDQMQAIPNDYSVGKSYPEAKIGTGGVAAVSLDDGVYYFLGPTLRNDNGANSAGFYQSSVLPSLIPSDAMSLDIKLDDGIPSTGVVRAIRVTNSVLTTFANDPTLNSCLGADNQSYNLTTDQNKCRLIVKGKIN